MKNPEINNFRDLNQEWFLLGAVGGLNDAGDSIVIHTERQASNSRIDVRQGGEATRGTGIPTNVLVHGILMTLAWVLFAFVGLFTARYMRQVWEPNLLGKKAWFTVHLTLMTTTVLLTITATVLIFFHVKGWSSTAGAHPYCGIIAIGFALVQPIMAAFRPHPGAPRRDIFNWSHRIVGVIALVMAVVSIYLGLCTDQVGLEQLGCYAGISFCTGVLLIILFELYLILSKHNKGNRSVSMSNTGDIQMQQPGHQAPPQPGMSVKEAMIRTMMFVFVVLLGASITLSIILHLALKK